MFPQVVERCNRSGWVQQVCVSINPLESVRRISSSTEAYHFLGLFLVLNDTVRSRPIIISVTEPSEGHPGPAHVLSVGFFGQGVGLVVGLGLPKSLYRIIIPCFKEGGFTTQTDLDAVCSRKAAYLPIVSRCQHLHIWCCSSDVVTFDTGHCGFYRFRNPVTSRLLRTIIYLAVASTARYPMRCDLSSLLPS